MIALRKRELLYGREVKFDPVTDWYLMAWDAFMAEEFRDDESRKPALALGLNLDADLIRAKKVVTKKSASVAIQLPGHRVKRGMVDADLDVFDRLLDADHTAMTIYDDDGPRACRAFLERTVLPDDAAFNALIQAMINAIPRTRDKTGVFVRPEAKTLDDLRTNYFPDLSLPRQETPPPKAGELFGR